MTAKKRLQYALLLTLTAVLFYSRLHSLDGMPPFFDETGNIIVSNFPESHTILSPSGQGRPLLAYQFRLASILPFSPIVSARLTTAGASILSAIGFSYLLYICSGLSAAVVGLAFWSLCPLLLFHDRMALQDPFSTFFLIIAACLIGTFLKKSKESSSKSYLIYTVAGVPIGLAIANKISAILLGPAFFCILFYLHSCFNRKFLSWKNLLHCLLILLGGGLTFALVVQDISIYAVDLFSLKHNPVFLDANSSASKALAGIFTERLYDQLRWTLGFNSLAWFLLLGLALLLAARSRRYPILLLGICYLGYYFLNALVYSNRIYARYSHSDYFIGLLFVTLSLHSTRSPSALRVSLIGVSALLLLWGYKDFYIVNDIQSASIPSVERKNNLSGYYGGSGLAELRSVLASTAEKKKTIIFACDYFCSGFYYLKSRALVDTNYTLVPLELRTPYALAWIHSYMKRYPSEEYRYLLLFEPNTEYVKYHRPSFLDTLPLELSPIAKIKRDAPGTFFILEELKSIPESALMELTPVQNGPYPDLLIGPRTKYFIEIKEAGKQLVIEGVFPRQLKNSQKKFEVIIDGRTVGSRVIADLGSPFAWKLPLELSIGKHELELRSGDWILPRIDTENSKDFRLLSAKLKSLRIE
jgi:hypothetical protein